MIHPPRLGAWSPLRALSLATLVCWTGSSICRADDSPAPPRGLTPAEGVKSVVPNPPLEIPDDPPPHEGALLDIPYIIEAPDIIVVEVLVALPGRPITGERLVRTDGKISLGFYGDVHVQGLTPEQAKVKILHHLRNFLLDDVLGLVVMQAQETPPLPPPGTSRPYQAMTEPDDQPSEKPDAMRSGGELPPETVPAPATTTPPKEEAPKADAPKTAALTRKARKAVSRQEKRAKAARTRASKTQATTQPLVVYAGLQQPQPSPAESVPVPRISNEPEEEAHDTRIVTIDPAQSERVFVDIVSFNSKVYYVQGDVGTPGRLPITGKETVLDALIYAGGFTPVAEGDNVHLYRPARGSKPARDYKIDFMAIMKGDSKANLQMFPGDRIFVARNAVVAKTLEIDRIMAPVNSMLNFSLFHSTSTRALGLAAGDVNGTTQATRDQILRRWYDLLWNLPGGSANGFDPARLLEAVGKLSSPAGDPKPAPTP